MTRAKKKFKEELKFELIGIFLIGISLYIFWSIFHVNSENLLGILGSFILRTLNYFLGSGKILIPIILILYGIRIIYKREAINKPKMFIVIIFVMCILAFLHMSILEEPGTYYGRGGGIIGWFFSWIILKFFGTVGTYIFLIMLSIACIVYITGITFKDMTVKITSSIGNFFSGLKEAVENFIFTSIEEENTVNKANANQNKRDKSEANESIIIEHFSENESKQKNSKKIKSEKKENNNEEFKTHEIKSKNGDFILPTVALLEKIKRNSNLLSQRDINENIFILQKTLESFGVKGKVAQVSCGPSITRYEFQPAPGVKVSRIVNLADDIALSLASAGVRIEAPIPGKAAIGIEVPNKEIATVSLREVLESDDFMQAKSYLTVALGKDIGGKPITADLTKMPHLLIAGATGSGKSVCMNSLITSILFKSRPNEVKFLMIDPKMVELTTYNGIPHLISPVVTDAKKAASALRWAVQEMEKRYELFASAGVKDIERYNNLIYSNQELSENLLPYIVVLIDELADLMMVAPADVEDAICRLAQMARAAGIHLVVATQRPSVDVITGTIKANIPSRIAFAVSSQTDSRTILDMNGAEKLLGRGDMLFYPTGLPKPIRLQGVFLSDKEVEKVVNYLKEQKNPEYLEEITNVDLTSNKQKEIEEEDDELIPEAAKVFIENGQASISLIQRRFRVGYTRAARIIDIMEKKGIIGGYEGSKPRQVLITVDDYERMFGQF